MSHTGKEGEWMKRITKIDKTEPLIPKKLRVAAYCRVSTGSDEQLVSLEAQKSHYESFIMVNPFSVKKIKELDDNSPKKTDSKDPKTIAKLVVDGRYSIPYMPEGIYAEIRDLVYSREPIWII